jgi:multidrug efflux pump subunit AcrB
MRSRSFQVGLLVLLLAGAAFAGFLLLRKDANLRPPGDRRAVVVSPEQRRPPLTIVIETSYPGANARVVADTVAAPIEQQVNGVEGMLYLHSRSTDDGNYSLTVTFTPDTDPNMAQVLVQNRVALAEPVLPEEVRRLGVTIRKKSPDLLALVVLVAPDGKYDQLYLGNYATTQLRDELARVPGVAEVGLLGRRETALTIRPAPDNLRARGLTVADVVTALEAQNLKILGGNDAQLTADALGRLTDPREFSDIILKASPEGKIVYLRDVATIELGAASNTSDFRADGKPAVALTSHPLPGSDRAATRELIRAKLDELRKLLPDGLDLMMAFDFAADPPFEPLLLDVHPPDTASMGRTVKALEQCAQVARAAPGVEHAYISTEDPFAAGRKRPCVLLGIAAGQKWDERAKLVRDLRGRLEKEIADAVVCVNDLAARSLRRPGGYSVDFVALDRQGRGPSQLLEFAERVAKRMRESGKFTDVWVAPRDSVPHLSIDIDRTKAAALGVSMAEVQKVFQAALGPTRVNRFNRFGRTMSVVVQPGEKLRGEDITKLTVRSEKGEIIPLRVIASVREDVGPDAVERFDLYPAVEITANPAPEVNPLLARAFCEKTAGEEGPQEKGIAVFPLAFFAPTPGGR